MRTSIFAFLLLAHFFIACKEHAETAATSAADLVLPYQVANKVAASDTKTVAADIVFKSSDGGKTWEDVSAGLPVNVPVTQIIVSDHKVFMATEKGLYYSPADVPNWQKEEHISEKIATLCSGGQGSIYVSSRRGKFLQGVPGTEFWNAKFEGLEQQVIHHVHEMADGTTFTSCLQGIFKSSDAGTTWERVFAEADVYRIVEDKNGVLLANSRSGLVYSTDKGAHWKWAIKSDIKIESVKALSNGWVVIAKGASWSDWGGEREENKLLFTDDQGKTWERMDKSLPNGTIYDLEEAGEYIFCGHQNGVFRSADQGKTWEMVHPPKNDRNMIILAPAGRTIFATMFLGC